MNKKSALISGTLTGLFCSTFIGVASYLTLHLLGYIVQAVTHNKTFTDIFMQFKYVEITLPIWLLALSLLLGFILGYLFIKAKKPLIRVLYILAIIILNIACYVLCTYFAKVKGVPVNLIIKIVINILNSGII